MKNFYGHAATLFMSAKGKLNGGIAALFAGYLLRISYLLPMVFLWRTLAAGGADLGGFTLSQLLTYTCISVIFRSLLNVHSGWVTWHYEGQLIDLYRRPQSILSQFIIVTVGAWLPELLLFSLPLILILPLFGVNVIPASAWFWCSLALSISLGFAVDIFFSCFFIHLKNAVWLAYTMRNAITLLLSGAVIPFDLLPWGMGRIFKLLPFGSLAAAPLSIFVGTSKPPEILFFQIFWNLVLWPLAAIVFAKSRERLVSYGG